MLNNSSISKYLNKDSAATAIMIAIVIDAIVEFNIIPTQIAAVVLILAILYKLFAPNPLIIKAQEILTSENYKVFRYPKIHLDWFALFISILLLFMAINGEKSYNWLLWMLSLSNIVKFSLPLFDRSRTSYQLLAIQNSTVNHIKSKYQEYDLKSFKSAEVVNDRIYFSNEKSTIHFNLNDFENPRQVENELMAAFNFNREVGVLR